MFDYLTNAVANASVWAYAILLLLALLDAILPVVPSEATVITAGVIASTGDLLLPVVIAAAAVGAFGGDNIVYLAGARFGRQAERKFLSGPTAQRRLNWAKEQLAHRGGELIVVGRFVPGGRTAVALTAGTTRYPWRRFSAYDVAAAVGWASYAALIGYFGGKAFESAPWKGLVLALAIACVVTIAVEASRALVRRRRQH